MNATPIGVDRSGIGDALRLAVVPADGIDQAERVRCETSATPIAEINLLQFRR